MSMYQTKKRSYMANYWHHVLLSAAAVVAVFAYITHLSYQSVLQQIRDNWLAKRCSPIYMPFAGIIMPQPGQSAATTTLQNFDYCIQQDFSAIISVFLLPLEFISYMVLDVLEAIANTLLGLVAFFNYLKQQIGGESAKIMEKVSNLMVDVSGFVVKLRDSLAKINAIMVTTLFTSMTIYNIMVSGLVNVMNIITDLLIAFIAVVILLYILAYIFLGNILMFPLGLAALLTANTAVKIIIPVLMVYNLLKPFMLQILKAVTPESQQAPNSNKKK